MLKNRQDALALLESLGALDRLVRHAELVGQAADQLLLEFQRLGVVCESRVVELGAALHDAGKILHPLELAEPGSKHEEAGQTFLLVNGVPPEIAKCCVSHAAWDLPDVTLEEKTVALADKLWKGKREADLELSVIDEISIQLGVSRWEIFEKIDTAFEEIAARGTERVQRSTQQR